MALAVLDGIITFVHSTSAAVVAAHPAAILGVDGALPLGVILGLGPHGEQGLETLGIVFAGDAKVLRDRLEDTFEAVHATPHVPAPAATSGGTGTCCQNKHELRSATRPPRGSNAISDHACAARGWIVRRRDGIKPSNMLLARRGSNTKANGSQHAAWTVCVEASAVAKHARHN